MEGGGNKEPESSGKKGQEEGEKKRKGKEGKWVRARERGGGGGKGEMGAKEKKGIGMETMMLIIGNMVTMIMKIVQKR